LKILVDTSVWIDHLRTGKNALVQALTDSRVITHDAIIGELALGNLAHREPFLDSLQRLPRAVAGTHLEVMRLISVGQLQGRGVGYLDVHLLVSARLTPDAWLWTYDKRLAAVAAELDVSITP
jgi:hypothetical protein